MANPEPFFIDASGTTVRIDPPSRPGPHSNVMISIMTQDVYSDRGDLTSLGQRIQFWVSREKAKQISEALYVVSDESVEKLIGKP